jgi:DNA processing protein
LGTIDAGGITIAVMATGIDQVYPRRNKTLAERIVSGSGCLLTEMMMGAGPKKNLFPGGTVLLVGCQKG